MRGIAFEEEEQVRETAWEQSEYREITEVREMTEARLGSTLQTLSDKLSSEETCPDLGSKRDTGYCDAYQLQENKG